MEVTGSYVSNQTAGAGSAPVAENAAESRPAYAKGEVMKGQVVDLTKTEASIKLPSGEVVKGGLESFPDAKIGDNVKFTVSTNSSGQNIIEISPRSDDARLEMMKQALAQAGLKADEGNLKIVSLLLEKELPISKESILALAKAANFGGEGSLQKAAALLKNDIMPTATAIEKLDSFITDSGKLQKQIEALAKNIMSMENGPEKQRLLQIFAETVSGAGDGVKATNSGLTAAASNDIMSQIKAQNSQAVLEQAGADKLQGQMKSTENAVSNFINSMLGNEGNAKLLTGTQFFRETFRGEAQALAQLNENPVSKETGKFITENLDKLKAGFAELAQKGEVTKESVQNLIRSMPGGEKILEGLKTEADLKSFMLKLALDSGTLKEHIEKASIYNENISKGAKSIAGKMSFSVEGKNAGEMEKVFENLTDKLSQIAKSLGDGKESGQIKQGLEELKDNLRFLERFKNDVFMQIPITLNDEQKNAELYVFSGKGNKNKKKHSQSALISLDLANLGHFETYVQKTEKSVQCQFRLRDKDIETLVSKNIHKLSAALQDEGYVLSNISFKQTDEKFVFTDGEKALNSEEQTEEGRKGGFSMDLRC